MKTTLYDFVLNHANNTATGGLIFPDQNLELDWQALRSQADAFAAGLLSLGIGRESVVFLCGRNSSALLSAFLGAQRAGATPSILAPRMSATADFIESLLLKIRIARPAALLLDRTIADEEYEPLETSLRQSLENPYAAELRICRLEEIKTEGATLPDVRPSSLAFLQFTSGSVLNPRAVRISHENLEANCRAIIQLGQVVSTDVWVSWLPLFHDMGLVGATGVSIISGGKLVLVDPSRFIENPTVWLKLISKHRATITVAPNMAYSICATKIPEGRLADIDLSSLRIAFNGAEPINRHDLEAFTERMTPLGFNRTALVPCYGLAENTLAVSASVSSNVYSFVRASAAAIEREGVFREINNGERALEIVSVGKAIPNHEVRVVNPETQLTLPEGRVGEVQAKGPSVAQGYLGDEFPLEEGWLKTGDLGFIHRGELYVAGRLKDLIKKAGRGIFPTDIETLAAQVEGVRAGGSIAFEFQHDQRPQVGLVVESKINDEGRRPLAQALRRRISEGLALSLDAVWIVPPKTIPKTTSGKLQRRRAAQMAEAGRFGQPGINELHFVTTPPDSDHLREVISEVKPSLAGSQYSLDATWAELGIDSLDLQSIIAGLEARLDIPPVDGQIGNIHTPASLLRFIQKHSRPSASAGAVVSFAPRATPATAEAVESSDGVKAFAHQLRLGSALSFVTAAQCADVRHKGALFAAVRDWTEQRHGSLYNVYLKGGSAPRAEIGIGGMRTDGPVRIFSTNHYLGLHRHSEVLESAKRAIETHGAGVGTSAPSGGYTEIHRRLEDSLTNFVEKEAGITFPTGYTANLGTIAALCGRGDRVVVDKEIHASVVDGCRLSGAAIEAFRHNDVSDLERVLDRKHAGTTLVAVESVYSMGGDDSDLASIINTAHAHGALVMVDESHAFGFYGRAGAGLSEARGVLAEVDLFMTTMSKSLASLGGFVAGDRDLIDLIRWSSRSFIFQACATPASIASAEAALRLIGDGYGRERLWMNTRRFREGLAQIGLSSSGTSPIVTVPARTAGGARRAARSLLERGVFAPAIIHPAVALDESRLRFTITASHTAEDIDCALDALDKTKRLLSVIEETGLRASQVGPNRVSFAELAASAEMLKEMMTSSGPRRLAIEADGCPKILIESRDATSSDSSRQLSLILRGDVGMLSGGSATELIDRIASEQMIPEGDISSFAWLCFAIKKNASAPRIGEYEMAAD